LKRAAARGWAPALGLLLVLAAILAAWPRGTAADGAEQPQGDFRALPRHVSRDGVLDVRLVAQRKDVLVDGVVLHALTFNGEYGGPVLELKPGDTLRLHLDNRIELPINIHFHGSYASPQGDGDNVGVVVPPGAGFTYTLKIPRDQPPGLYWYHTHIHGIAEEEVNGGLSGAMIIDGAEARSPEIARAPQRLLVLKTFDVWPSADPAVKRVHGVVQSINGAAHSEVAATAGRTEFWRLSNQSANDYYHLQAKGLHFRIIELDGAPTNREIAADRLDIPPAGRVEALVDMPRAPGDYPLLSGATPTGVGKAMKLSRELAVIRVAAAQGPPPPPPAAPPPAAPPVPDLRQAAVSAERLVVFAQKPDADVYYINGRTYDPDRIDARVPLGAVEEWTLRNDTDDIHVFHIHQVHFQVVSINGEPQPFDYRLDTVRVPERGEVKIRIAFTDPQIVGRFVYHCHVLRHEDAGMMANIVVYDPRHPDRLPVPPDAPRFSLWRWLTGQAQPTGYICRPGQRPQPLA